MNSVLLLFLVGIESIDLAQLRDSHARNVRAFETFNISCSVERSYKVIRPSVTREDSELVLQSGHLYSKNVQVLTNKGKELQRNVHEMAYNGHSFFVRDDRSNIQVFTDLLQPDAMLYETKWNYLSTIGVMLPESVSEWSGFHHPRSLVVSLIEEGVVESSSRRGDDLRVTFKILDPAIKYARNLNLEKWKAEYIRNGSPEAMVNAEANKFKLLAKRSDLRTIVIDFAIEKGFAIKNRDEFLADGRQIVSVHCSDFKKTTVESLWLPRKCVTLEFASVPDRLEGLEDSPYSKGIVTVSNFSFEPKPEIHFSFEAESGNLVTVHDKETKSYIGPATEDFLSSLAKKSRWRLMITSFCLLLVIGTSVYLFVRAKQKS